MNECVAVCRPTGRIILVDFLTPDYFDRRISELETIDDQPLFLLDCRIAAMHLDNFLRKIVAREEKVLFVFPGNGANYPKRFSEVWRENASTTVFAKRLWTPGSDPIVMVGQVEMESFMDLSVHTIIVVDDVISSGQTMRKLYERNALCFPAAKWIGGAWVSRRLRKHPSGISGYEEIFASFLVPDLNGRKCPINSLSTLVDYPEIAKSYAERNFKDARGFFDLMQDVFNSSLDHHIV